MREASSGTAKGGTFTVPSSSCSSLAKASKAGGNTARGSTSHLWHGRGRLVCVAHHTARTRYVRHGRGWYAWPVRTVRRPREVRVSIANPNPNPNPNPHPHPHPNQDPEVLQTLLDAS